jgi:hypothetical protein
LLCSSSTSSLSVSLWDPLSLVLLQTAPPLLDDCLTDILRVFRTKDDRGKIWSEIGLLPVSTPLDFAEKFGVENCLEECSGRPNMTAAQGWQWECNSRIWEDVI